MKRKIYVALGVLLIMGLATGIHPVRGEYHDHNDSFVKSWYGGRYVMAVMYLSPSEMENVTGTEGLYYAVHYSRKFSEELSKTTAPGVVYELIESIKDHIPFFLEDEFDKIKEQVKGYEEGKLALDITTKSVVAFKLWQEAQENKHLAKHGYGMLLKYIRWGEGAGSWSSRFILMVEAKSGAINVIVKDDYGNRLKGAAVYLDGNYRGKTDNNGFFKIKNVKKGYHTVKASKKGYKSKSKRGYLKAGVTATCKLVLEAKKSSFNLRSDITRLTVTINGMTSPCIECEEIVKIRWKQEWIF